MDRFSFYYPEDWNLKNTAGILELADTKSNFRVKIEFLLDGQPDSIPGKRLVASGPVQVANFDQAHFKKYDDGSLQFFLIKGERAVKIDVNNSNLPQQMKLFDVFLGTVVISH